MSGADVFRWWLSSRCMSPSVLAPDVMTINRKGFGNKDKPGLRRPFLTCHFLEYESQSTFADRDVGAIYIVNTSTCILTRPCLVPDNSIGSLGEKCCRPFGKGLTRIPSFHTSFQFPRQVKWTFLEAKFNPRFCIFGAKV